MKPMNAKSTVSLHIQFHLPSGSQESHLTPGDSSWGGSLKAADWGLLCDTGVFLSPWFHSHNRPQSHPGKGLLQPFSCGLLIVTA